MAVLAIIMLERAKGLESTVYEEGEITMSGQDNEALTRGQGCKRCGTDTPWRHWPELHRDGECWDCGAEITVGAMCGPCILAYQEWRRISEAYERLEHR